MEREAGGKPLHNLPYPASGNPILKIDDRPAPVVPYPHLALSASRIGACARTSLHGRPLSLAAIALPTAMMAAIPASARASEAVNTKATSVMVMAAAVKRTERMLCMIVTFLFGMWVLATPLARGSARLVLRKG